MAQNYQVTYDIQVLSGDAARNLNSFTAAINKLSKSQAGFSTFLQAYNKFVADAKLLTKNPLKLGIQTDVAKGKLSKIIRQLQEIHRLSRTVPPVKASGSVGGSGSNRSGGGGRRISLIPSNPSYRVMGPSTIDSGGVGAIDMMKGMGIAYGISGIGQLIGNVVRQATEYENLMQTTRNILGAHDKGAGFDSRFKEMERIVRQVTLPADFDIELLDGKTKKTLPEWAAMGVVNPDGTPIPQNDMVAGLVADVRAITENQSTELALESDADVAPQPVITAYLTYPNFYRIKKWNNSNWYAIAIATLADNLK